MASRKHNDPPLLQTENVLLAELHHPERNVRLHPEAQIVEFVRAIEMFGQTRPIIIDEDNTVLAGNGLMMALQRLGREQASVLRMTGLSPSAKTKLMLSDNKIYALGHDDYDGMMTLIRALDGDLQIPGFDATLLESLISSDIAANEALNEFGRISDEDKASRGSRAVSGLRVGAETQVVCPHCGKEFRVK